MYTHAGGRLLNSGSPLRAHFDALVDLSADEQRRRLEELELSPTERTQLEQLLSQDAALGNAQGEVEPRRHPGER